MAYLLCHAAMQVAAPAAALAALPDARVEQLCIGLLSDASLELRARYLVITPRDASLELRARYLVITPDPSPNPHL